MATAKKKTKLTSSPPKLFTRNDLGLLEEPSISYEFNEDGSVNWRKMIKPEYLVSTNPNETDVSKLTDKDLLILLGGIKELAQIRGYRSVEYKIITANPEYVCAVCKINWIGNYETSGETVSFEAVADTHLNNTTGFTQAYLAAMAENRAFVRCVRNFLKINIVGKEEVKDKQVYSEQAVGNPMDPINTLVKAMNAKNLVFEDVKKRLIKDSFPNAEGIGSLKEIPTQKIFDLISRIRDAKGR